MLAETLAYLALASVVSMFPIVIAIVIAWADKVAVVNFYSQQIDVDSLITPKPSFSKEKTSKSLMDIQTQKTEFLLSNVKPLEMISEIITLKNVMGQ
ncbi:MAG: hypothetical protein V4629_05670 [Pseudomonadota bacterium]